MKKLLLPLLLAFALAPAAAQDSLLARSYVDTLTSATFWGRGYTRDGMAKAAGYLQQQFIQLGLQPLNGKDFFQHFSYPVNTFPGNMQVTLTGKPLQPGTDYLVAPESRGIKMEGALVKQDSTRFVNAEHSVGVMLVDKLTWSVAPRQENYTALLLDKHRFTGEPSSIQVNIENKFQQAFKASNIAGMVKGTGQPDSVIFITAHYDHLGGMGSDVYFPGANDNASGISLLLTLAKYYAAHPQKYSIGFICFAGEEAGLVGSKYYAEHPWLPLPNIRFLVNLDLSGTGNEGITVVNATEYPREFAMLQKLNNMEGLLADVKPRGKAANSDHYWFSEKGVPAFFIYTLGGIKAYHDVFDQASTLPLNEINDLNALVKSFVAYLNGQ